MYCLTNSLVLQLRIPSSRPSMARTSQNNYQAESALLLPCKQFTTSHMCHSVNHVRHKVIKRTMAEKAQLWEKHQEEKTKYHEALEDARNVVIECAECLREQFGHHSSDYYYKELMQHSRKIKAKRDKISLWNAFTR